MCEINGETRIKRGGLRAQCKFITWSFCRSYTCAFNAAVVTQSIKGLSSYAIVDSDCDNNSPSLTNLCSDFVRPDFLSIAGFAEIFFCSQKSPKESVQLSIYFISFFWFLIHVFHFFGSYPFLVLTSNCTTDWCQGSSCNGKKRHSHNRPATSSKSETKSPKSKSSPKTAKAEGG